MSLSIQTNVASLIAQQNLSVNSAFQNQTIEQLTSGYRINSASDDAAGLAVANKFRDDIAELTQGVSNANDGVSQLQIADGGLTNISNILDRLKTLATESATNTFTGDRNTLNNEYQSLLTEINRQASNIGMVTNGSMNQKLQVYIGGGSSQSNAMVNVDLGGTQNTVDSAGLNIGNTSVAQGGVTLTGDTVTNLNDPNQMVLTNTGGAATEVLNFSYIDSTGAKQNLAATVSATSNAGITVAQALSQLNTQLSPIGLQAGVNSSGRLVIGGTGAFEFTGATETGTAVTNELVDHTNAGNTINTGDYNVSKAFGSPDTTPQILAFSNGSVTQYVTLDGTATGSAANAADNAVDATATINKVTHSLGIYAFSNGSNINLQSTGNFSVTVVTAGTGTGTGFDTGATGGTQVNPSTPLASQSVTGNSLAALSAIENAVAQLGQVQGRVGAGENQLNYAISLAQSQITNFSSAQSQIRDADVAKEAANLTKAQVLQQASIAAMAQANSAPQALLSLLKT
ncbi:MAG TPA: flagellin [Bryobacteraceae bacterium]|nr:flagellin [Bryobacteraceae bacterium]